MHKKILRLAIPNIISNLTVPLLTVVDLHLMGYLNKAQFMGAVALGGVIFNLVYWGFSFLRMSVTGLAAQHFGERDDKGSAMVFLRGILLAIAAGALLVSLQVPIAKLGFWLLSGSEEVKVLAQSYFHVRIWAAPAAIMLMVINGWFLGMQNARFPMTVSILINVVNILSSVFFVRVLHLQERGVALGSVIAQYSGLIIALCLFAWKYKSHIRLFDISKLKDRLALTRFGTVSGDIFIRTLCLIAVFTFFTSASASFGDLTLAANTALLQYLMVISYFLDGFAFAAEALIGRYSGERSKVKLAEATRKLFFWGGVCALLFTLGYGLGGDYVLLVFTDQKDVIETAKTFLPWAMAFPVVSFASYIWDGIYIGATASKLMRNTMLFAAATCFFLPYYCLEPYWGNHALWFSMVAYMAGRSLSQTIMGKKALYTMV